MGMSLFATMGRSQMDPHNMWLSAAAEVAVLL
ncbi:unnamed protein product [Ectocarpus sp. CCAP 1310/34]|nr:unnamed protein product [Ectocarpus sp. CCAP 1310/34]